MIEQPRKSIPKLLYALISTTCKILWNKLLIRFSSQQYYLVILTGVKQNNERSYWQTLVVTKRSVVPVTTMVQDKIKTENLQRCCCIGLTRLNKGLSRSFYDDTISIPLIASQELLATL